MRDAGMDEVTGSFAEANADFVEMCVEHTRAGRGA
jgi:hypothetical protein